MFSGRTAGLHKGDQKALDWLRNLTIRLYRVGRGDFLILKNRNIKSIGNMDLIIFSVYRRY